MANLFFSRGTVAFPQLILSATNKLVPFHRLRRLAEQFGTVTAAVLAKMRQLLAKKSNAEWSRCATQDWNKEHEQSALGKLRNPKRLAEF